MIKKLLCIWCILNLVMNANGQRRIGPQIIRGGLVKVALNFGPGFFINPSNSSMNIGGELEVYLTKRVSIRNDISFYIPTVESGKVVAHNHSLFWGFSYHMPYKKLDFCLGLEPGLSIVQSYNDAGGLTNVQAIPVISAIGGCQIYFSRFFHCHVLARFVTGQYFRNASTSLNMTDIRIMVGFGFHINMVKLKKSTMDY